MKSAFTLSMLAFLLPASVAVAQPGGRALGGLKRLDGLRRFSVRSTPVSIAKPVPSASVTPVWKIPAGKYGLQLKNGTRIVGQPTKGWSTALKTSFGTVTIPLAQITRLEPVGNGQYSAFLKNGDRVTGVLVSKTLAFETEFGKMVVPTPDLVRLSSASATTGGPAPKKTSTTRKPIPTSNAPGDSAGGTAEAELPR